MPAGLIVYNDHGTVQIDETYRNLAVAAQGTPTMDGNGAAATPVIHSTTGMMAVRGAYLTRYFNWPASNDAKLFSTPGQQASYYLFDVPSGAASFGFQVFTAAGDLAFDAAKKYARVRDTFTTTGPYPHTRTYDAGRTYAAIIARAPLLYEVRNAAPWSQGGVDGWYYEIWEVGMGVRMSGASVIFDWMQPGGIVGSTVEPMPVLPPSVASGTLSAHIIDVTGY